MSVTDPLIGQKLGDYLLKGLLGTGGMARVYQGYDSNLDRYAAIKVIEPQLIASDDENEYRERFLREARAIARLNHPRIVSVYQFNQVGNRYYIAMEYVPGRNLRDILKEHISRKELVATEPLIKILTDIADALDYAHNQKIIHRDVKPSNVIVDDKYKAILTDFGLALNAVEGTIGNTFGSVHYIAPEQAISSAQAVPQSDQYSLGIVAYEMLTGQVPFDDASAMSIALKHISDPPQPPSEVNPNIPAEVEQVLMKALDKEPSRRYDTVRQFVNALVAAFEANGQINVPPPDNLAPVGTQVDDDTQPPELAASSSNDNWDDWTGERTAKPPQEQAWPESGLSDEADDSGEESQSRTGLLVMGVVVMALLLIAAVLIAGGLDDTQSQDETAIALAAADSTGTQDAIALAAVTEEASETPVPTDTTEPSTTPTTEASATSEQTNTPEPSETATDPEPPTATLSPTETVTQTEPPPTVTATATQTPMPTPTPTQGPTTTPALTLLDENDPNDIVLRYDGRMLLVGNLSETRRVDVSDLVFVLFEPDDEDGTIRQSTRYTLARAAFADRTNRLLPGRCFNIMDSRVFSAQPSELELSETLCAGTPFWTTTINTFWVNASEEAYFEVRLGAVDVLMRCPTQLSRSRVEVRCVVDLDSLL